MKRILVPCDFSEPAKEAFSFAVDLASLLKGEIFVLQVNDVVVREGDTAFSINKLLEEFEAVAQQKYETDLAPLLENSQVTAHFSVMTGAITSCVRTFIESKNIDAVVMGTHGASGLQEFFIGSNTEKIVRFSPVPVIAIRHAPEISSVRNIVVPATLELNQTDFMSTLQEWQRLLKATLHILVINTPVHFRTDRDAKEEMEAFARHYKLVNYTLNMRNDFTERDGIMAFAQEIKADMIAMGTHGYRGLVHLFVGSITEDVVNRVDCPIWTYSLRKK